LAGVCASAVKAGTIDSSNGSAIVVPTPSKNVRLAIAFFVTNIESTLL
jgi:hypothetical protein